MILLNPGPVNVSERVRRALQRPDICHRESEFSELLHRIQQKLLQAFVPGAESDYVAVVLSGSGTSAVEAAVMSCLPHGKRMMVINNGVYGERISNMIGLHRLGVSELKLDWSTRLDPERLRLALRQHPEVHAVAMVHHETTTGLINNVKELADVVDRRACVNHGAFGPGNVRGALQTKAEMRDAAATAGVARRALEDNDIVAARRLHLDEIFGFVNWNHAKDAAVERERPLGIANGKRDVGEAKGANRWRSAHKVLGRCRMVHDPARLRDGQ